MKFTYTHTQCSARITCTEGRQVKARSHDQGSCWGQR